MKSPWLNNEVVFYPELPKPCRQLGYCPYGELVEEYPLRDADDQYGDKLACLWKNGALFQFGHDCPVHYLAEMKDDLATDSEIYR